MCRFPRRCPAARTKWHNWQWTAFAWANSDPVDTSAPPKRIFFGVTAWLAAECKLNSPMHRRFCTDIRLIPCFLPVPNDWYIAWLYLNFLRTLLASGRGLFAVAGCVCRFQDRYFPNFSPQNKRSRCRCENWALLLVSISQYMKIILHSTDFKRFVHGGLLCFYLLCPL